MSARALSARIDSQLSDWQRKFIRPMAALSVRFSGEDLPHAGRAVSAALDVLLARAPVGTGWRGVVIKGAKSTRYAAPRPVTAAGLRPAKDALEALKAMPPRAFQLYVKDGSVDVLAPDAFAVWVSLAKTGKDTFATPRGLLSAAFPLEELEAPAELLALGDQMVELLDAEVASLGPAVWLAPHCLFNSSSNELPDKASKLIELFGVSPQLDAPHLHASRWPHAADEVKPDLWSGLLAPSWTMWLDAALAKKVKDFPGPCERRPGFTRHQLSADVPFTMTEETYAGWRAGWEALAPVRLRCEDTSVTGKYFRERLSGETHAELLAGWRAGDAAATAKASQSNVLQQRLRALRESGSAELVEVAKQARGLVEPSSLLWDVVPALTELILAGKVEPAVGLVWLDYGEEAGVWKTSFQREQTAKDAAALAAAAGAPERAFSLLRDAFTDARGRYAPPVPARKRDLARDRRFASLRKLPAWRKLVAM